MKTYAGVLLIIGSIVFLASIFNPYMIGYFDNADDNEAQLTHLEDNRTGWTIANVGSAVGSVIAGAGLVMLALMIRDFSDRSWHVQAGYLSAVLMTIAALLWIYVTYNRVVPSPEEVVRDSNSLWGFFAYTLFMLIAIVAVGVVLFHSRYLRWTGLFVAIFEILTIAMFLPLFHYVWLLVAGIALVRAKPVAAEQ